MTIKIILILAICLLVIFVAYKIYAYYKARQNYYQNMCDFCSYLESQINFLKTDICKLIENKREEYYKEFSNTLLAYKKALKSGQDFKNEFLSSLAKLSILSEEEKNKILSFFDSLGKTNQIDQLAQISSYKKEFENNLDISKTEITKKGATSLKLGILMAIAVFVIFI